MLYRLYHPIYNCHHHIYTSLLSSLLLFLSDHQYLNSVKQLTAQKSFIREDIFIKFNEAEKIYNAQVGGNDDDTYSDDDGGGISLSGNLSFFACNRTIIVIISMIHSTYF